MYFRNNSGHFWQLSHSEEKLQNETEKAFSRNKTKKERLEISLKTTLRCFSQKHRSIWGLSATDLTQHGNK